MHQTYWFGFSKMKIKKKQYKQWWADHAVKPAIVRLEVEPVVCRAEHGGMTFSEQ